jgi:peptide/nickel transport system permease protein
MAVRIQLVSGVIMVSLLLAAAVFAPWLATHDPCAANPENWLQSPGGDHLLGTDRLGRDVFSRVLYGGRVSLAVGILAAGFSVSLGTVLGGIAGYFGGPADMAVMRLADIFMVFPTLFLTIALASIFNAGLWSVVLIIGVTGWPGVARLVRAEYLRLREADFVVAARMLGASHTRVMWRHLLPCAAAPIAVAATLGIPGAIMAEAGLGYFGLGAQPPLPTWGNMLREAQLYMRSAWWYATFPGLAVFMTTLSFNILGEGLRNALDPRRGGKI